MLVNFIPVIFISPFLGLFVDRLDRKKIMILGDLASMLLTLLLVVLLFFDAARIWHIYLVIAGRAVSSTFQANALSASVPMIVPEEHLVRANGLNRTLLGMFNLVGPPLGAFLMAALPVQWVLSVDIVTATAAMCILLPLKIPRPERTTLTEKLNVIRDMTDGFRYLWSWKGMLYLTILYAILNFFAAPVHSLLPLFVENYLGNDVLKLGWLQTSFGAGIIAGGILLSAWGGFKRRILTSLTGFIIWCIAILLFGFTRESSFYFSLITLMVAGLGNSLLNTPMGAILQSRVERDMQGRVFSLFGSLSVILLPIALGIAGPVTDSIGIRAVYVGSGGVMLVLVLAGFFSQKLMHVEDVHPGMRNKKGNPDDSVLE